MMSCVPGQSFQWFNVVTIPLGLVCLCDSVCEAALDTVFLPIDYPLSCVREKKGK